MTGYGEDHHQSERLNLSIELRALNNRYLKVSVRAPEPYNLLEAEFEKIIRREIRRGTVQVQLRIEKQSAEQDFRINPVAFTSYWQQLRELGPRLGIAANDPGAVAAILALPGVVAEPGALGGGWHEDWPL